MKKDRCIILFLTIVITTVMLTCCAQKKPSKKPPRKQVLPDIPQKISQGKGKEPKLVVYNVDKDEREEMNIEDYVTGVVAGEMENYWPKEALATQAILARTYVLEFITDKGGSKYGNADISTDFEEAQAWNPDNINDNIKKAVKATRGKVITHKGRYIKAWFHSHSGGMTATAKEGLDFKEKEPPYIQIVESSDEKSGPAGKRTWVCSFSKDELRHIINDKLGVDPGEISEVKIVKRGPSGRATKIKIGNKTFSAPDLRIALGSMDMRSTLLTSLKIDNGKIVMKGKGFGHGVGLSQWGANVMAKKGKSSDEIIRHFFKDIEIVKLWD